MKPLKKHNCLHVPYSSSLINDRGGGGFQIAILAKNMKLQENTH